MSFLIDPPLLFIAGFAIGSFLDQSPRTVKVVLGLAVVLVFLSVSLLLYLDVLPCFFPFICTGLSGSEFMFHSNLTGIYKKDVPQFVVIFLFALYPLWIYAGHALAMRFSKYS
ncbi:MAG: hypothetical protein FIB08_12335 [Candidatus Methanoperedens sp.]|nr:hypothetical protein [Candidatus Methanoperedens sp.]